MLFLLGLPTSRGTKNGPWSFQMSLDHIPWTDRLRHQADGVPFSQDPPPQTPKCCLRTTLSPAAPALVMISVTGGVYLMGGSITSPVKVPPLPNTRNN
jgi:hypothetical protein